MSVSVSVGVSVSVSFTIFPGCFGAGFLWPTVYADLTTTDKQINVRHNNRRTEDPKTTQNRHPQHMGGPILAICNTSVRRVRAINPSKNKALRS